MRQSVILKGTIWVLELAISSFLNDMIWFNRHQELGTQWLSGQMRFNRCYCIRNAMVVKAYVIK